MAGIHFLTQTNNSHMSKYFSFSLGDSGAPLFDSNEVLVGVASFIDNDETNCAGGLPNGFIDVSGVQDFIKSVATELQPSASPSAMPSLSPSEAPTVAPTSPPSPGCCLTRVAKAFRNFLSN